MENHRTAVSVVRETLPLDPIPESDRIETSVAQICGSRGSNVPVFHELRRHSRISPRLEPTPVLGEDMAGSSERQKKTAHSN